MNIRKSSVNQNRKEILLLIFACLNFISISNSFAFEDKEIKKCIVVVTDRNNQPIGTGTFLNRSGLIITAKHVVEDPIEMTKADSYYIRTNIRLSQGEKSFAANLVAVHPFLDVAILKAEAPKDLI